MSSKTEEDLLPEDWIESYGGCGDWLIRIVRSCVRDGKWKTIIELQRVRYTLQAFLGKVYIIDKSRHLAVAVVRCRIQWK